jgi:hypothetical protein
VTFATLKRVLEQGDKFGSSFKEILAYYGVDLSKITEEQAVTWLRMKEGGCDDKYDNESNK